MKIFSKRLKDLRGASSQTAFAKKYGVSQVAYGRWELGQREPDLETVSKICQTEVVSADWLLGLTDTRTPGAAPVVTATGGSAASGTGNATVQAPPAPPTAPPAETSRLIGIIESQQRVIDRLSALLPHVPRP